ncbi:MAG: polyprenol monophosphomannose synthase [Bacteroidetes bacterium]|nr:polyprenol monophosphomannose synthase [Bacteroidota bacterium]MDA0930486.1 polyprenol monophosphomannose synthase [Bacteroidota bacterium]
MSPYLVVVPTYNEIENIERMVHTVMALPSAFDLLIVDDGSPDGTAEAVEQLQANYANRLHLLKRTKKEGLGKAYLAAFDWGLERDYQFIFEMDCDFSHNPADLERLLQAAQEGAHIAIGSRYVTGVNVVNWPMGRVLLSYYASAYVRLITGMSVRDATAGFVCYRRDFLQALNFNKIRFKGYAFQIEMKYIAFRLGYVLKEVPIIFTDRQEGTSKISKKIIKEAIWGVISLRLKSVKRYLKK